jgi:hypothetical protein
LEILVNDEKVTFVELNQLFGIIYFLGARVP